MIEGLSAWPQKKGSQEGHESPAESGSFAFVPHSLGTWQDMEQEHEDFLGGEG